MITIRHEQLGDEPGIRHVNEAAFGRPNEADLVETLRDSGVFTLSLVALRGGEIAGHVLFSPVQITSETAVIPAMALGPVAVLPQWQQQGIGSRLITNGLQACRAHNYNIVVVIGHPTYYPRFGFTPAKPLGIRWEHTVPDDVFMVTALKPAALTGVQGVVSYHPAFNSV